MSTRRNTKKPEVKNEDKPKTKSAINDIPQPSRKWSIEQETALYKAICRFKPSGKHKHFRMVSIYLMLNNPAITPSTDPITIEDIWEKLSSLYDLDGLDELEDSSEFMAEEERLAEDPSAVPYHGSLGGMLGDGEYLQEFYLPWNDFSSLIAKQAIPTDENISDSSDDSDIDDDDSDLDSTSSNSSRKRDRSDSIDSLPNSDLSESENEEPETKKVITGTNKPKAKAKKANTPASRKTRTTRQRAAAVAAAAAVSSNSKTKAQPETPANDSNDDEEETGTEQSEREDSPPPENTKSNNTRSKRSTRTAKQQPKSKAAPVPTRRSTRRK